VGLVQKLAPDSRRLASSRPRPGLLLRCQQHLSVRRGQRVPRRSGVVTVCAARPPFAVALHQRLDGRAQGEGGPTQGLHLQTVVSGAADAAVQRHARHQRWSGSRRRCGRGRRRSVTRCRRSRAGACLGACATCAVHGCRRCDWCVDPTKFVEPNSHIRESTHITQLRCSVLPANLATLSASRTVLHSSFCHGARATNIRRGTAA